MRLWAGGCVLAEGVVVGHDGIKFDADRNLIAALSADCGGRMLVKMSIDEQARMCFSDPRHLISAASRSFRA